MPKRNKELEDIKLFVACLLNKEQDEHSALLAELKSKLGKIKQYENLAEILTKIYDGKVDVLKKVYRKIQEIE